MDRATAQSPGHIEVVDPSAETIINGTPFDAHSSARMGTPPIDQAHEGLSDEIKRRQVALTVRYISIVSSATR